MTRINVIDPAMLSDKHLGAEYRELPRVFGLVRQAAQRGEQPNDPRNPRQYLLGKGHVRFFYPRLGYLSQRYLRICAECHSRGRKVAFGDLASLQRDIPLKWFGHWNPTPESITTNIQRIEDRGGLRHANNP